MQRSSIFSNLLYCKEVRRNAENFKGFRLFTNFCSPEREWTFPSSVQAASGIGVHDCLFPSTRHKLFMQIELNASYDGVIWHSELRHSTQAFRPRCRYDRSRCDGWFWHCWLDDLRCHDINDFFKVVGEIFSRIPSGGASALLIVCMNIQDVDSSVHECDSIEPSSKIVMKATTDWFWFGFDLLLSFVTCGMHSEDLGSGLFSPYFTKVEDDITRAIWKLPHSTFQRRIMKSTLSETVRYIDAIS